MALRFRPMPGLTLAVLICLPILIGLGAWQYARWQWKTEVLAEVDVAVMAPPIQGLRAFKALEDDAQVNFRRIVFDGEIVSGSPVRHLYRPDGNIQWVPFTTVEDDGVRALVAFPPIPDGRKEMAPPPQMEGPRAGYIKRIEPRSALSRRVGAENNPDANRWFEIMPDWLDGNGEAVFYIDASDGYRDGDEISVRRPDIPNNHVSYILTWWSFAVIMLVIYALLHKRAGRLSWD